MITLVGIAVCTGAAIGGLTYVIRRSRQRTDLNTPRPLESSGVVRNDLRVGDALIYANETFWLSSSLIVDTGAKRLQLFHCPSSESADWIMELNDELPEVLMLSTLADFPSGSVPRQWNSKNRTYRFDQAIEGEVSVTDGVPIPPSETGSVEILSSAGGRRIVIVRNADATLLCLEGPSLERHLLQHLPGDEGADVSIKSETA